RNGALPEACTAAFVGRALEQDGYVQAVAHRTLQPWKQESLIYCQRIMLPAGHSSAGTLCLCLDLAGEMGGIFASHHDPSSRYNMVLLPDDVRCIASADPVWIPPATRVPTNAQAYGRLEMFAGRLYLIATRQATWYHGYPGSRGWRGQVMMPLDT